MYNEPDRKRAWSIYSSSVAEDVLSGIRSYKEFLSPYRKIPFKSHIIKIHHIARSTKVGNIVLYVPVSLTKAEETNCWVHVGSCIVGLMRTPLKASIEIT